MQAYIKTSLPVPMIVIIGSWELLHLVYCDWPADEQKNNADGIVPMIVAVEFLLALIDFCLKWLNFFLVDCSFHQFHVFVFDLIGFAYFLEDKLPPKEGERHRGN